MKNSSYRSDVDGLRAIAVIAVIIYHLKESWLSGGFLGVDIFLVISGFIMTKIIFSENFDITSFYINRIKRILPAFLFVMAISFIAGFLLYSTAEWELFTRRFKKSLIFVLNNFYSSKQIQYGEISFFDPSMHTWSLGLEMQFYLLYSIVMCIFFYIKNKFSLLNKINNLYIILVFFVISLLTSEILLKKGMDKQAFYLLFPRVWEFIAGGFIALIYNKINKNDGNNASISNFLGLIGFLLIVFSFIFVKYETSLGLSSIAVVLGSALIILSGGVNSKSIISKLLSLKYVTFIGLISYSLYLWHWPIIAFVKQIYGNEISIIYLLIMGTVTVPLAYLTYRFIEKPFRNPKFFIYQSIGRFIKKANLLSKIHNIIILLLMAIFMILIYFSFNYLSKIDEKIRVLDSNKREGWGETCTKKIGTNNVCLYYSKNKRIDFLLLGNSMISNNLEIAKGIKEDFNLGFYKALLVLGEWYDKKFMDPYMKNLTSTLDENNIKFVFIAYHFGTENNGEGFYKVLNELKKRNIKMIFLGIPPSYKNDTRTCLFNTTKIRLFLITHSKNNCLEKNKDDYLKEYEQKAVKEYNALYLDTKTYLMDDSINSKYYADSWHLTPAGSKFLYSQVKDDFIPKILEFVYGNNPPKKVEEQH